MELALTYNTVVVVLGCAALGLASGAVGLFALLRGRALLADAIGHAALPGVVAAALVLMLAGGDPRALGPLLLGAALAGALGLWCVRALSATGRLRPDAAIGVVLASFYALGTVGLSVAQALPGAAQAGLGRFILGQAATMTAADAALAAGLAALCLALLALLFHPLRLLCFDPEQARLQGWRVGLLDGLLLALVLAVCVAGLPAVGLVLVVALLVVPAAAGRLVATRLPGAVAAAGLFGALAGAAGALASARMPGLPTGAAVVLAGLLGLGFALALARGGAR